MQTFYIYAIVQNSTNKHYIGSTSRLEARKAEHLSSLKTNSHCNAHLQRAYNKYGIEDFTFLILEESTGTDQDKFAAEQEWIDSYEPEFNIGSVGGGDNLTNNPNRLEIIEKIRKGVLRHVASLTKEERLERWSQPMELNPNWKGGVSYSYCSCGIRKSVLAKTCVDCRDRTGENNPFYGHKHSDATKEKLRQAALARAKDPNHIHPQSRKVMADGIEYPSLSACARAFGKVPATILHRIRSSSFPTFYYIDEMPNDYPEKGVEPSGSKR